MELKAEAQNEGGGRPKSKNALIRGHIWKKILGGASRLSMIELQLFLVLLQPHPVIS